MNNFRPMSYNPLKIFISSSWQGELNDDNKAVAEEIISLDLEPITGNGISDFPPILHCHKKVNEGNILIVILGKELRPLVRKECHFALQNYIPILGFIKEVDKDKDLTNYIKYLRRYITYDTFSSIKQLRKKIKFTLIEKISESFRCYQIIYKEIFNWLLDGPLLLSHHSLENLIKAHIIDIEEFFIELMNKNK